LLTLLFSCSRRDLAAKYFEQALFFMPFTNPTPEYPKSRDFDYQSLMISDSTARGAKASSMVLWDSHRGRKDVILSGGNRDPNLATASALDMERLKALYPQRPWTPAPQPNIPQQGAPFLPGKRSGTGNATHPTQSCPKARASGLPVRPVPTVQSSGAPAANRTTKRWYSVPLDVDAQPQDIRAWPPCADGTRTITYCFENQDSYDSLHELLGLAFMKWAPAIHASALAFAPDEACTQGRPCLCSIPEVAEVTLRISLVNPSRRRKPLSTIGYKDRIIQNPRPSVPRHYILWPYTPGYFGLNAPLIFAHELGKQFL
jgi:hypothetical protein